LTRAGLARRTRPLDAIRGDLDRPEEVAIVGIGEESFTEQGRGSTD
jgi:hypothetical protein